MLTEAQRRELLMPFALEEHGFLPNNKSDTDAGRGNPYIKKSALRKRLDRVCGSDWSLGDQVCMGVENDAAIMRGTLTLAGQSMTEIGTGIIERVNSKGEVLSPYTVSRNTAKAFKSAASDLLPRCAQMFGVGWYLRDIPPAKKGKINDQKSLAQYIAQVAKQVIAGFDPETATEPTAAPPPPAQQPESEVFEAFATAVSIKKNTAGVTFYSFIDDMKDKPTNFIVTDLTSFKELATAIAKFPADGEEHQLENGGYKFKLSKTANPRVCEIISVENIDVAF